MLAPDKLKNIVWIKINGVGQTEQYASRDADFWYLWIAKLRDEIRCTELMRCHENCSSQEPISALFEVSIGDTSLDAQLRTEYAIHLQECHTEATGIPHKA